MNIRRFRLASLALGGGLALTLVIGGAASAVWVGNTTTGQAELRSPTGTTVTMAYLTGVNCRQGQARAIAPINGTPVSTFSSSWKCGQTTATLTVPTYVLAMRGSISGGGGAYVQSGWYTRAGGILITGQVP